MSKRRTTSRRRTTRRRRSYSSAPAASGGSAVGNLLLFVVVVGVVVWLVAGNRASASPSQQGNGNFFTDWLPDVFPGWEPPKWNFFDAGSMFYYDVNTYATPGSAGPNEYGNSGYAFGFVPRF